jgi:hypothetical protein
VKTAITASVRASKSPTADDKKGGFHEEGGQWIITPDGGTVPLPAKPGPANPEMKGGAHIDPTDAMDAGPKSGKFALGGTWHVHPSGILVENRGKTQVEHGFSQPPSDTDIKEAGIGINVVVAAREKKVYFYDGSGVIGHPMKLKDFLTGC